jgi:GAF domain-containing protein/ActR/RegA family two-component response regulator/two-component sensor histidine kinase
MCRVLILDDNFEFAQLIKIVIEERSNNTAHAVATSPDAIELVTRSMQEGKPYEVLLIDHQLSDGENGIEAMQALRRISPDSETIIFTGYGDGQVGMDAYRAGAFRYLAKPFENQELLYLIEAIREWHHAREEQDWQKIFSEFMEAALQEQHFHETAEVVVKFAVRLGFHRAHLFWVPTGKDVNKGNRLVGIACEGLNRIREFKNRSFSVLEWFDLDLSDESNAIWIHPFRDRTVPSRSFGGYRPSVCDAAILPIWQDSVLKGLLLLDFDQTKRTLGKLELSHFNLFARQVSVVLNHASLRGREQKLLQESAIIQEIGRQINAMAASAELIDLLEEVRRKIGQLMDVSNFSIFLLNEETVQLDFPLHYDNDIQKKVSSRPTDHGFEEYLLNSQKDILLSHAELQNFIGDQHIHVKEPYPLSLLGVPLRVENKTIGGIVVFQKNFQDGSGYLENDKRILLSVADQVAGAIQISRLVQAEKLDIRRMQVLQRANTELLQIVHENEDHFWLTLLTIATSGFGLGFNRALLFLEQENYRILSGRMGVGTDNTEDAKRDWERDEQRSYSFESFLADLDSKKRRQTPFESLIRQVEFKIAEDGDAVSQVIKQKTRVIVEEAKVSEKLPAEITGTFSLTRCAILPLRTADRVIGVVIVDNKHNRELLQERSLERLQNLLDNAGLVYETFREQKKSASLLRANYEILGGANDQNLGETLSKICLTAQTYTAADWVIILPLLKDDPHKFDYKNIGYAGSLKHPMDEVIGAETSFGWISQRVFRRNTLVVPNIEVEDTLNQQLSLSEHHFIREEGVQALIGAVIRRQEDEKPLGILYLDYRQPRSFSDEDIEQAVSFANLAGVAITNAHRMDKLQQRTEFRTAKEIAETVGTGLNLETTLGASMQILQKVFENTRMCVLLYLEDINALKFAPGTLAYYKIPSPAYRKQDTFPLDGKSIACRVAKDALQTGNVEYDNVGDVKRDPDFLPVDPKTRSELCISLMSTKHELLGILVMESYNLHGLDYVDEDLVKTVAQQLSSAIEFAQQSEDLQFHTTVAARTSWAADMAHDINREVGQIRNWASILMDRLENAPDLQTLVRKIEESASMLSNSGPWSDSPPQVIKLDLALVRNAKNLTGNRNLTIDFRLNVENVYIRVNPVYFQRVLRHLVRNASRAMINSKIRKIIITTHALNDKTVEILFQDTGPGISEEIQLSIFQRPVTTKSTGGFGLLLVRQMIENMGGQIRYIPQKKGHGAKFSIMFPIATTMEGIVE